MEEIIVIALFKEKSVTGKGETSLTCVPLDKGRIKKFNQRFSRCLSRSYWISILISFKN